MLQDGPEADSPQADLLASRWGVRAEGKVGSSLGASQVGRTIPSEAENAWPVERRELAATWVWKDKTPAVNLAVDDGRFGFVVQAWLWPACPGRW
jgi:hypothetical protein